MFCILPLKRVWKIDFNLSEIVRCLHATKSFTALLAGTWTHHQFSLRLLSHFFHSSPVYGRWLCVPSHYVSFLFVCSHTSFVCRLRGRRGKTTTNGTNNSWFKLISRFTVTGSLRWGNVHYSLKSFMWSLISFVHKDTTTQTSCALKEAFYNLHVPLNLQKNKEATHGGMMDGVNDRLVDKWPGSVKWLTNQIVDQWEWVETW